MIRILFIVFLSTLYCSCSAQKNNKTTENATTVSIINLISNPLKYHNKKIILNGYLKFEHEGNAIYLNKEDYLSTNSINAIYIRISDTKIIENGFNYSDDFSGMIQGVFDKNDKGHLGLFSGSINRIEGIILNELRTE
ncbi:hypothetical protein [Aurantibacter sp.]|uniref:hypothetical protein n=1 Tax=Aurantibacter sp. TaxID=2807103 RepID=UPI0035C864AC